MPSCDFRARSNTRAERRRRGVKRRAAGRSGRRRDLPRQRRAGTTRPAGDRIAQNGSLDTIDAGMRPLQALAYAKACQRYPTESLRAKLAGALPNGTRFDTAAEDVHPAIAAIPGFGRARMYVWTVTADRSAPGARPAGEYKIQMILPNQERGTRATLDLAGAFTSLLGYSPDFGVFVGWQAELHAEFAYSRNVQCREELLREARNTGWAVASPRVLRGTGRDEVRIAFTPGNLLHYLRVSREADREGHVGKWREACFLAQTPNARGLLPGAERELDENIERQRERVTATRWVRDRTFSAKVKEQYDESCAVCSIQLEIVEGAHIIHVREEGSSDQVWNGIALCPNHHELFDGSAFVVDAELHVRVDEARVEYLEENDLASGIQILTDYRGEPIHPPYFWERDEDLRQRMTQALTRRTVAAGLA